MIIDEKTLAALSQSKQKWYDITFNGKDDLGVVNCALCKLFRSNRCHNCPICKDTSIENCDNTPYNVWRAYLDSILLYDDTYHVLDDISRSIAWQEYLYLDKLQRNYKD